MDNITSTYSPTTSIGRHVAVCCSCAEFLGNNSIYTIMTDFIRIMSQDSWTVSNWSKKQNVLQFYVYNYYNSSIYSGKFIFIEIYMTCQQLIPSAYTHIYTPQFEIKKLNTATCITQQVVTMIYNGFFFSIL